eukprot:2994835-Lingulodinium_polyedra.AAC.1
MLPGDVLIMAVGAGGRVDVSAAGERAEVIATTNLWARVRIPLDAAARAAVAWGHRDGVRPRDEHSWH